MLSLTPTASSMNLILSDCPVPFQTFLKQKLKRLCLSSAAVELDFNYLSLQVLAENSLWKSKV